jgi:subtilisin-like proprotein convertase family protein
MILKFNFLNDNWLQCGLFLMIMTASVGVVAGQDSINAEEFAVLDRARAESLSGLIIRNLALADEERVDLVVSRVDPFAPDAVLTVDGVAQGPLTSERIYFHGTSMSDGHTQVSLSIGPDGSIRGVLADGRGHWRLLTRMGRIQATLVSDEPARGAQAHDPFQCGLDGDIRQKSREAQRLFELAHPRTQQAPRGDDGRYRIRLAYDTTARFVALFNTNQEAIDYLGDLTNYISIMYIRELNTEIVISSTVLRDLNEPWDVEVPDPLDLLDQFETYWNDPGNQMDQTRTLAHLVDAGPPRGVAYVGVLCANGFDYGVSQGLGTEFDPEADPQGWSFNVVAHEVGHNFNSDHTHCYNPVIDQCFNGEAGNGCWAGAESLPGPADQAPGTIMSYCHLLAPGFGNNISVTLGRDHAWGNQPERVPDTMRAHVLDRAAVGGPRCPQLVEVGTSFLVSTSVQGDGTVSPTSANVPEGETTSFTLTPAAGADLISANGCGGNLNANTFTTGPVTATCTVNVVFSEATAPDPLCVAVNQGIPDDNPQGISSTLSVTDVGDIEKLELSLDIDHTWVGDLIVDLEHEPTGATVRLVDRPGVSGGDTFGCSGEDIKVVLDDDAGSAIQDDCQSPSAYPEERYRPANALSAFAGLALTGDWILTVSDNADGDTGQLQNWCLLPTLSGPGIFIDRFEQ